MLLSSSKTCEYQFDNDTDKWGTDLGKNADSIIIFHKNTELLGLADKAIYYFREQQYDKALTIVAETIDQINYIVEKIITDRNYFNLVSTESLIEMLTGILKAKKNKDYILLADLYEMQLVNFLCSVQQLIVNKEEFVYEQESYEENIRLLTKENPFLKDSLQEAMNPAILLERGYRVEFSSCGLMTLGAEAEGDKFYFHTNNRISKESFLLAKHWYKEDIKNYVIYGFGFGYHLSEVRKLAPDATIEVYESDSNILQLACAFTDMKPLLEDPKITIIYDPDYQWLKERLSKLGVEDDFEIHYPSLKNVKDKKVKKMLENYIPWSKVLEYC